MRRMSEQTLGSQVVGEEKPPDKFEAIPEDEVSEEDEDSDDEWDMPSTPLVQNVQ